MDTEKSGLLLESIEIREKKSLWKRVLVTSLFLISGLSLLLWFSHNVNTPIESPIANANVQGNRMFIIMTK